MESKWIDVQVNGRIGIPFNSPELTEAEVLKLTEHLRDEGTAGFVASITTTCAPETAVRNIRTIVAARKRYAECEKRILGLHFEGPFISTVKGYVGAHDPARVCDPDIALLERYQDAAEGLVRLVTIAAEAKGAETFTRQATAMGVTVSIGHSTAWEPEVIGRLAEAGAKSFTHLGNALPALLPRHDNVIWTGLAEDRMMVQFIPDGFHLRKEILRVYTRAVPLERLVAVSDCSFPGGLPPGEYNLHGDRFFLEPNGFLRSAAGTLHGSSCTMAQAMRNLADPYIGFTERELQAVGHDNPLRLIGLL